MIDDFLDRFLEQASLEERRRAAILCLDFIVSADERQLAIDEILAEPRKQMDSARAEFIVGDLRPWAAQRGFDAIMQQIDRWLGL